MRAKRGLTAKDIVAAASSKTKARKPSITRGYHHGDTREALVEAGLKILSERAADDLSLREVARTVGVSATAVYRHFKDKHALLAALSETGFERLAAAQGEAARKELESSGRARAAMTAADYGAAFNLTGYAYVRFALDNPALFRLMFSSAKAIDMKRVRGSPDPALAMLRDYAQKIAGGDATAAADFSTRAWAMVHGLATLLLDKQIVLDDKAIARIMDASAVLGS